MTGLGTSPTSDLGRALRTAVDPPEVRDRALDRLVYAHDASHYSLVPQAVVSPAGAADVGRLLAVSAAQGIPLTFRAGGTSLSGQSSTAGVLVDVRRHFRSMRVLDDGARVAVQPGVTVRAVNARLAAHGRKLGPDPASEVACTIGGVVANNSSGMACGTAQNTYATLDSLVLVLPSGNHVDTGAPDADERLRALEPELYAGLLRLRDRVRDNADSVRRIRQLFAMKNTMGYGVNSFLDHDSAVQILAHLVVGSEGTLAFVAEATFRTVPVLPHTQTSLLVFPDLRAATGSLEAIVSTDAATIELMDATSLRVAQRDPQAIDLVRDIPVDQHAALLVEYQADEPDALTALSERALPVLSDLPLASPLAMTSDSAARAALWHMRKGLYATVAGARPTGTTALLEDVVVPVPQLLDTCVGLIELFDRHQYRDSVIFGHAKDGNVHFLLNEEFSAGGDLARYSQFTDDMVDLVLGHGGSLKAEHGTGRIMAPFVRRQYGDELYEVMREVKRLCDPQGVLSPGVVIDDDPQAHLRHLKVTPEVEAEVDRCVECGFCEPVCPSRDLTTTPRQRIALRRARATAELAGDHELVAELERDQQYDVIDTCAVDGMCQTACPVKINTGELVRRLRAEGSSPAEQTVWKAAAKQWGAATGAASTGLTLADALPAPLVTAVTRAARAVAGDDAVPLYTSDLPPGGARRPADRTGPRVESDTAQAVFFGACVGAMFGPAEGSRGVTGAFRALCERAGVALVIPAGLSSLCCGTPWKSKGMTEGYAVMRDTVLPALWTASRGGELPVVCDASSCTEGLHEMLRSAAAGYSDLRIVDSTTFVYESVLPQLPPARRLGSVVVHPTCSSTRLGTTPAVSSLAAACADDIVIPADWGCCAFAGDRGMLHPELTASATAPEATELAQLAAADGTEHDAYVSSNRTCEIGMTRATGHPYRHVLELLEERTR